jgi:hypothetical protein
VAAAAVVAVVGIAGSTLVPVRVARLSRPASKPAGPPREHDSLLRVSLRDW